MRDINLERIAPCAQWLLLLPPPEQKAGGETPSARLQKRNKAMDGMACV